MIEMLPLTIVSNVDGIARIKECIGFGIIETNGVLGVVFSLEVEAKSIRMQVC